MRTVDSKITKLSRKVRNTHPFATQDKKACHLCPLGKVTTRSAQSTCTPCTAGRFSNANRNACEPCPVGTYSDDGAHGCGECPARTYSQWSTASSNQLTSQPGAPRCVDCCTPHQSSGECVLNRFDATAVGLGNAGECSRSSGAPGSSSHCVAERRRDSTTQCAETLMRDRGRSFGRTYAPV